MHSQQEKANTLLSLHKGKELLILPNIWNPIGARILVAKGYPAIKKKIKKIKKKIKKTVFYLKILIIDLFI